MMLQIQQMQQRTLETKASNQTALLALLSQRERE